MGHHVTHHPSVKQTGVPLLLKGRTVTATPHATGAPDAPSPAARLDRLPVGRWHWKLTVLVGIGAFYEYYEVFLGGVLAAVLGPLWQLNSFETASLIASVFLGMFFGALTLGRLADRIGRRRMFLINLTIYLFFSLVAAFAPNLWVLVACRFIAGIGAGAEAALIPAYLAEFIPPKRRGRHIGYAFTMAFLAYPVITLIGAPLAGSHFLIDGWRWLLVIGSSGILALLWFRRGLPESPRWLASVGRLDEADALITKIEKEIAESTGKPLPPVPVTVSQAPAHQGEDRTRVSDLFKRGARRAMIAAGALWTLNVLAYYGFSSLTPLLLADKGYDLKSSLLYTAVMAIGYPLGAFTAALIAERYERRTVCIATGLGTAAAGLFFGFGIGSLMIMAAGFAIGFLSNVQTSSINMYGSEVFPTRLRTTAIGLCYGTGRLCAVAIPFLGIAILDNFGGTAVVLLSVTLYVVTAVLVWIFGPKTTGKSLEEITEEHRPSSPSVATVA